MNWVWVQPDALAAIQNEQLAEHGGAEGVRDEGVLESALARPENIAAYGELSAYTFGIIKKPFVDGNKKAGLIAGVLFLEFNGYVFSSPEAEVVALTLKAPPLQLESE